jgi:membrane fusion protein (multidrug efflux system)
MTRTTLAFASVLALGLGLGALGACKKGGGDEKAAAPVAAPAVKLAPEDIVVVENGTVQTGPRISGALEASQKAVVRAETAGTVVAIGAELGDPVKKGDLLARVEAKAMGDQTTGARAGLTAAQAQYELAKREVTRTEALVKGGAIAQRELDRAQSQLAAAQAAVTQARAQVSSSTSALGDTAIKAPFPGLVAKRSVNKGDVVMMGTELYQIIDPSTMRLDASVASDDLAALQPGKPVDFQIRGYPGQKFTGSITRIAPAADPVTRQIQVLVDLPNPGNKLVAGLYAEGRVRLEERDALVVPLGAIDASGDQPTAMRAKGGTLERVTVALGLRDERAETVEITSGLAAGDVVVLTRASKNLIAGARVEVPGAAPATAPAAGSGSAGSATGDGSAGSATGDGSAVRSAGSR